MKLLVALLFKVAICLKIICQGWFLGGLALPKSREGSVPGDEIPDNALGERKRNRGGFLRIRCYCKILCRCNLYSGYLNYSEDVGIGVVKDSKRCADLTTVKA